MMDDTSTLPVPIAGARASSVAQLARRAAQGPITAL
jgi:hypothetical protein